MGDAAKRNCQNIEWERFGSVAGELTRGSKTPGAGGTPVACCRQADAAWRGWGWGGTHKSFLLFVGRI